MTCRNRSTSRRNAWLSALGLGLALASAPVAGTAQAGDLSVKLRRPVGNAETRIRPVRTGAKAAPKRTLRQVPDAAMPAAKEVTHVPERPEQDQQVTLMPAAGKLHARLHGPDLQPAPEAASYCDWVLQGTKALRSLRFKIENRGTQIAHPTDVRVSIDGGFPTSFPIGGYIYAGSSRTLNLAFPETCFANGGICSFTLEVDGVQQITETNELNNTASGSCQAQ